MTGNVADAALDAGIPDDAYNPEGERERLVRLLADHQWKIDRAAAVIGVHRATMYRWVRRLGIVLPSIQSSLEPACRAPDFQS